MKTIIAGSRTINSMAVVAAAIEASLLKDSITEVVSGRCPDGVDLLGEIWAANYWYPVIPFPVTPEEWRTIGRSAGPKRNKRMGEYADQAIVIWDGMKQQGSGSYGMYEIMEKLRKPVFLYTVPWECLRNASGGIDKWYTLPDGKRIKETI